MKIENGELKMNEVVTNKELWGQIAQNAFEKHTKIASQEELTSTYVWNKTAIAVVENLETHELLKILDEKVAKDRKVYAGLAREWAVFATDLQKLKAWHDCYLNEHG